VPQDGKPTVERGKRRYRVEHWEGERVAVLGAVEGIFAHFTALDPFLAALPAGSAGEVILVDEATGAVVARRYLERAPRYRYAERAAGPPPRAGRRRPPTRPG
jgi:hypothetical protein